MQRLGLRAMALGRGVPRIPDDQRSQAVTSAITTDAPRSLDFMEIPAELRIKDVFHHIDMGFLNRRLCLTALPPKVRAWYIEHEKPGTDHMTVLGNDHLLVTVLLDVCEAIEAPTLVEALTLGKSRQLFRSTERLAPCPELYEAARVDHEVELDVDFGKPVRSCITQNISSVPPER